MSLQGQIPQSLQNIADRLNEIQQRHHDERQQIIDLCSGLVPPEPIHYGTLVLPAIEQLSHLSDSIDTAYQYAAGHADENLCQMLQQIRSQMDALYPRLIEPGEEATV